MGMRALGQTFTEAELQDLITEVDLDLDGDDLINFTDIKSAFARLGEKITDEELAETIREVNGQVVRILVTGAEIVDCNGLFQQDGERNGHPCFTRAAGQGALFFEGSYWKLSPTGRGPMEQTWRYSQKDETG